MNDMTASTLGDNGASTPQNTEITSTNTQESNEFSWSDHLPQELAENNNFKKFSNVQDLATSYLSLQSMLGDKANLIKIPDEHSSDEAWNEYYAKTGRPETAENYSLPEEIPTNIADLTRQKAYDLGITDKQLTGLLGLNQELSEMQHQAHIQQRDELYAQWNKTLHDEYAGEYENMLGTANKAFTQFVSEEDAIWLDEQGLNKHPSLIKMFAEIGKQLSEDTVSEPTSNGSFKSVSEIKREIDEITLNVNHPYYDANHIEHQRWQNHVGNLYSQLHPENDGE